MEKTGRENWFSFQNMQDLEPESMVLLFEIYYSEMWEKKTFVGAAIDKL